MKRIDILIIKAFLGPFIASLFIGDVILVLQTFWVLVDQLAGKGMDVQHILKFTFYLVTIMLSKSLPVAILMASIMAYGNLSETSEITVLRAAGISFGRITAPIGCLAVLLSIMAFFINNTVVPESNRKLIALRYDVIQSKPAFSLEEGVFYTELNDFVILVNRKNTDNRSISGVVIYQQTNKPQDNLILSKSGIMETPTNNYLRFILDSGWYYQDEDESQFVRFNFSKYVKDFALWQFQSNTSDSLFSHATVTQNVKQLREIIVDQSKMKEQETRTLEQRYLQQFPLVRRMLTSEENTSSVKGSFFSDTPTLDNKLVVKNRINNFYNEFTTQISNLKYYEKNKREATVEFNEKFVYSLICLTFFLIGAPIGSMIKKGGLGLPFVFAVIFFVFFVYSDIFAQKASKEIAGPDPYIAIWTPSVFFLLLGIGLFLRITGMKLLFWKK